MSVKSQSPGGSGEASANATASSTRSLTSFSIARTSASARRPAARSLSRNSTIGSRSFSRSTSSLVRYTAPAGSRMEWPRKRYVRASRSAGVLSRRARSTARPTAARTARTSMPSTGSDGIPYVSPNFQISHRAPLAFAEPVAAPEQLGHHAARVGALEEAVPVLAVGRDRVVVGGEARGGAGGPRLLADGEVEEPADLAERVGLRRLLLEATDDEHVAQKLAREVGVEPEPRRRLLSHRLGHSLPPAPNSLSYARLARRGLDHRLASPPAAARTAAPRRAAARTPHSGPPPPSNGLRLPLPPPEAQVVHPEATAPAGEGGDDGQGHPPPFRRPPPHQKK